MGNKIPPFFILGNPRSGTSLLRLMLNSNPKITVPPECGFAVWLSLKYNEMNFFDEAVVNKYVNDVFCSKKFETWNVSEDDLIDSLVAFKPKSYLEAVDCVYRSYAAKQRKNPIAVGDKNNYYMKEFSSIKSIFPYSKIIFIVRDGRDVACSYREINNSHIDSKYKPILNCDVDSVAKEWSANAVIVNNNKNEKSHTIRYEDLVTNTEAELEGVCDFLNVRYDPSMLSYYKKNDEPEDFLQWKLKTTQKPDIRSIGRYKSELPDVEVRRFENIAGDMLRSFGYV